MNLRTFSGHARCCYVWGGSNKSPISRFVEGTVCEGEDVSPQDLEQVEILLFVRLLLLDQLCTMETHNQSLRLQSCGQGWRTEDKLAQLGAATLFDKRFVLDDLVQDQLHVGSVHTTVRPVGSTSTPTFRRQASTKMLHTCMAPPHCYCAAGVACGWIESVGLTLHSDSKGRLTCCGVHLPARTPG
jgi:hypothetical protein